MLENAGVGARSATRPFRGLAFCQKNAKVRRSRSSSCAVSAASIAGPLDGGACGEQPASATALPATALPRAHQAIEPSGALEPIRQPDLEAARRASQAPGLAEVRVRRIVRGLVAVVVDVVVGVE